MLSRKDENKEKEAGNGPLKKHEPTTTCEKKSKNENITNAAAFITVDLEMSLRTSKFWQSQVFIGAFFGLCQKHLG